LTRPYLPVFNPGTMSMDTQNDPQELDEVLAGIWGALEHGVEDAQAPFHHPALATRAVDGGCSLRTVILRRVIAPERRLLCHTDRRSPKLAELRTHSHAAWLFYDPQAKVQIRASGHCELHTDDDLAEHQWNSSRPMSRRCYCAQHAPGTPCAQPFDGLPRSLARRNPTEAEASAGRANFAVIACRIDSIDWLYLRARGHRRARFDWRSGSLSASWLAP
jgi:3-hydroxyisobutyrate dehydrogenase